VKLARLRIAGSPSYTDYRPQIAGSPSYTDYRPKTNVVLLLDMGHSLREELE
jgi:hypothetical protein